MVGVEQHMNFRDKVLSFLSLSLSLARARARFLSLSRLMQNYSTEFKTSRFFLLVNGVRCSRKRESLGLLLAEERQESDSRFSEADSSLVCAEIQSCDQAKRNSNSEMQA